MNKEKSALDTRYENSTSLFTTMDSKNDIHFMNTVEILISHVLIKNVYKWNDEE